MAKIVFFIFGIRVVVCMLCMCCEAADGERLLH